MGFEAFFFTMPLSNPLLSFVVNINSLTLIYLLFSFLFSILFMGIFAFYSFFGAEKRKLDTSF
jgi:hypothetical protein